MDRYVDENFEKATTEELYSLSPSDDDTSRKPEHIEFDPRTMDDPQLCMGLLLKDVYQFKKILKNSLSKMVGM